jgi:hypothetical protein
MGLATEVARIVWGLYYYEDKPLAVLLALINLLMSNRFLDLASCEIIMTFLLLFLYLLIAFLVA